MAVLRSGKQSILFTDDTAVIEKESPFVFNPTGDEVREDFITPIYTYIHV